VRVTVSQSRPLEIKAWSRRGHLVRRGNQSGQRSCDDIQGGQHHREAVAGELNSAFCTRRGRSSGEQKFCRILVARVTDLERCRPIRDCGGDNLTSRSASRLLACGSSPSWVERQSKHECLLPRRALAAFETSRDFSSRSFVARRGLQLTNFRTRPSASLWVSLSHARFLPI